MELVIREGRGLALDLKVIGDIEEGLYGFGRQSSS
jgi:hypothetical protein